MADFLFHFELSAIEQDSGSVVFERSESTRGRLDGLDLGTVSFARCVSDSIPEVAQDLWQVPPKHLRHFDHRLDSAVHSSVVPVVKEPFSGSRINVSPELPVAS